MLKKSIAGFILLIILVIAVYKMLPKSSRLIEMVPVGTDTVSATPITINTSGYSLEDVAKHSLSSDCWSAVNGKVYDLTSWISQHPGGSVQIISICGVDGSSAFNQQHTGAREPAEELSSFYIGDLK
jgi:cytochrome b involved in lipid metabolism